MKTKKNCTMCHLSNTCTGTVWGRGNKESKLAIYAEAPGAEEDKYGYPLIGPSGILLIKMLESIGIDPDSVYYSNVVKCRPKNNATPTKPEIKLCTSVHLLGELDSLPNLRWIWILGKISYYGIHGRECKITEELGKEEIVNIKRQSNPQEVKSLLLYHPSYLMRNPSLDPGTPKYEQWKVLVKWIQAQRGIFS